MVKAFSKLRQKFSSKLPIENPVDLLYNKHMDKARVYGSLLLSNLFLNCNDIKSFLESSKKVERTRTVISQLSNSQVYSRILSGIKFDSLSKSDQKNFLFKIVSTECTKEDYDNLVTTLIQESHNRTCKSLGIKPNLIHFGSFAENNLSEKLWSGYMFSHNSIFFNTDKDYSQERVSYLLEVVNYITRNYYHFQKMNEAVTVKNSMSNEEFFLAVSAGVEVYLREQLREKNPEEFQRFLSYKGLLPMDVDQEAFSYEQTRKDFQSAHLYGGKIQESVRETEESYYEYLRTNGSLLAKSIISTLGVIELFKTTDLNKSSNGTMGVMLETVFNEYGRQFFNKFGADIKKDETLESYAQRLLDESNFQGVEDLMNAMVEEEISQYMEEAPEDEDQNEEYPEENLDDENSEQAQKPNDMNSVSFFELLYRIPFRDMQDALPEEGEVYDVQKLPFSPAEEQAQE